MINRRRCGLAVVPRAHRPRTGRFEVLEHRTLLSIFNVNTTTDENDANKIPGDLSLREAIIQSNATPGPNTIVVPAGTYNLTIAGSGETLGQTGDLDITNSVNIQGAGSASTIINGNSLDRVFYVLGSGSTVPVVSISGVTIEGGRAPDASSLGPNNGGGIEVSGATLTVDQSVVENNRTGNGGSYAGRGGGINVDGGTLTVTSSIITANTTGTGTTFGGDGGGISSSGSSTIMISNCTISNNTTGDGGNNVSAGRGGGVYDEGATTLSISNSTITGNVSGSSTSYGEGGGIYNYVGSTMSLDNSTVSFNTASMNGGGVMNDNGTTDHITNCTIAGNMALGAGGGFYGGGGILNTSGTINLISGTTISGNSGVSVNQSYYGGGGLFNYGTIGTIVNSTISGNTTNSDGGGILNNGTINHIQSTTIASNVAAAGGGIFHASFATMGELINTIIAGNTGLDFTEQASVTSATYDLVQASAGNSLVNGANGNVVGLDPKLGPLANNGGLTLTMALLTGSPAINAGTSTDAPTTDQRGLPRPSGAAVDIGAFEVQAGVNHPPVASSLSVSTNENTLLSGQVSATDADGDHLTYSVVTGPSQGSVALHSDGSFWYTPPAFYSGTDSFTFEAYDGQAYSNIATVSITIKPVTLPQVANIPFTTVADGTVADRNLDGTYDAVDTTSSSITDRWFTDPTIGQERGVFEFDLSRIAPGTPILSATIALDVTSYTASTVGGVTTYPQLNFMAATGSGSVTTADGASQATSAGTGTASSLGYQSFTLSGTALQSLEGGFAVVRLQNSALNANWFSAASLENTTGQPAMLMLQIASTPTVSLSIAPGSVTETAGANAATATLTRNGDLSTPLTVNLSSNNTSQLTVPASVTFAAGQSSLNFGVNAVDNHVHDNGNTVTVSAAATAVADPFGPDPSFGVDGLAPTALLNHDSFPQAALARQPDGKILAASEYSSDTWQLTRLNPDGSLDTSFGVNGVALAQFTVNSSTGTYPAPDAIAVQADGSILVGGSMDEGGAPALCRFTANGELDHSFGTNGFVDLSGYEIQNTARVMGIALRPDGRILLAMSSGGFLQAVQLMPNGTVDSSLYTAQTVSDVTQAVALLPNGQFLLAGLSRVARFNADGTLDTTFGTNGYAAVNFGSPFPFMSEIAIDPAGRIVVAGDAQFSNSGPDEMAVARLTASGALDTNFGSGGSTLITTGANGGSVTSLVVQADGKIVVGGLATTAGNSDQAALVRLTAAGALDTTFNGSGIFQQTLMPGHDNMINAIVLQPNDGRLLALTMGTGKFSVARFTMADRSSAVSANTTETVLDNDPGPPVAINDSYNAGENTMLSVAKPGVLSNDTDPNKRALTAALVAGPAHGTLSLNGDGSFTYTPATNFVGTDSFTYDATDGLATSSAATVTLTVTSAAQATFVKTDSTTSGNWIGVYGSQGYDIESGAVSIPSYATITPAGQSTYVWTTTSSDPRALATPGSNNRVAAVWYSSTSFSIAVNLSDGQAHDIALYALDWDNKGRAEQVQISSASTGAVLDTETLSSFYGGKYLQWNVTGNVIITVTRQAGVNAVVNGLFFDSGVVAGTATQLAVSAPTTETAGGAFSVTVTAKDSAGNVATGYTGTVAFTSGDVKAGLPANYTFTTGPGGDNGVHTFSVTLKTAGTQYVKATDTTTSSITGTQSGIVVQPAGAVSLAVTGLPNSVTSGIAANFVVTAYDPYGNVATGYTGTVHFTSSDSSASLPANYTFTTGSAQDNGTHKFTATLKATGSQTITATDSVTQSITGSESTVVNAPGASATFVKLDTSTQGNWQNVYGTQGYDIVSGAVKIPSYATVTPAGQSTYVWTTTSSDTRALATPGSNNRVAAVWDSAKSFSIAVNLNDGQAHDIALYALDWDNKGRAEQVQISSASTGTVLDTETLSSFNGGKYLQWNVTGNVIITVTRQAGANAVVNGLFFDSAVAAGTATQLAVSAPTTETAGGPFSVTVTAKDSGGNVATGYTGTVAFTSADVKAGLPANYTFTTGPGGDNGVHTFSVTLKTAGTQYVKATDTTTSSITGTQSGIVVQPAAAASLAVTGLPNPVTSGTAASFVVAAYDPYGNVATGYTGTVHFTSTDSSASLPANYTFTTGSAKDNGTHTFTATLKATGSQTITATDTVTQSITGSESTVVNAATASAAFVKLDTTTQGNWQNVYGSQGYDIESGAVSIPSYATITPAGQSTYVWTTTSSDPRALATPGSNNRVAAVWYSSTSFSIAVNLSDGQAHDIALYALDWDNKGRAEQVQISSASTGAVLDTETLSSFYGGKYLQWNVTGNVIITVTRQAGVNAVVNGLFFDPTVSGADMGAASVQLGVRSMPVARLADASSTTSNFLGVVGDEVPVVASGISWARATAAAPRKAAADTAITLAGAEEAPLDTKRPRPDGRLLQAAARRLARRPNAMVQNAWPERVQFRGLFSL